MNEQEYIPLNECFEGVLYVIKARNANIGIFNVISNCFIIRRIKFGEVFLFQEFHWDTGEPYGTVKPLKILEAVPQEFEDMNDPKLLVYLEEAEKRYAKEIKEARDIFFGIKKE